MPCGTMETRNRNNVRAEDAAGLRLALSFDAQKLRADLARIQSGEWFPHYSNDAPGGGWTVAALLNGSGQTGEIYAGSPSRPVPTPALQRCRYLPHVFAALPGRLLSARLMQLQPGARILPHTDSGLGLAFGLARLHIPITTEPALQFLVGGRRLRMRPGELWYADFSLEHTIDHQGTQPRTHLVMDLEINAELQQLLDTANVHIIAADRHPARRRLPRILPVAGDEQNNEPLRRIISFLREIGIPVRSGRSTGARLAPGLTLRDGSLIVDAQNLSDVADLLGYAGHLAIIPETERVRLSIFEVDRRKTNPLARGWAWAAARHLKLPLPEVHPAAADLLEWAGLPELAESVRTGAAPARRRRWTVQSLQ